MTIVKSLWWHVSTCVDVNCSFYVQTLLKLNTKNLVKQYVRCIQIKKFVYFVSTCVDMRSTSFLKKNIHFLKKGRNIEKHFVSTYRKLCRLFNVSRHRPSWKRSMLGGQKKYGAQAKKPSVIWPQVAKQNQEVAQQCIACPCWNRPSNRDCHKRNNRCSKDIIGSLGRGEKAIHATKEYDITIITH